MLAKPSSIGAFADVGKTKARKKYQTLDRVFYAITGGLLLLTVMVGVIFGGVGTFAITGSSEQSNVSVSVPNSCTLSGEVTSAHTATIPNGTNREGIGTTKMKIYCNDTNGYTVYAVGASNDEDKNTNLISSLGSNNIATGLATSGSTSAWAMQLAAGSGSGSTTTPPTVVPAFASYHEIPNEYTAVASRQSATSMDTDVDVTGSYFTTTYRVYVSGTQPAATYTGKVKYAVLHPYDDTSPLTTLQDVLADAHAPTTTIGDKTYYTIQGLTSTICSSATISGTNSVIQLADTRDNSIYTVAKLADGKCWMMDNLRLDPTNSTTAANMNASNTHAPAEAISNYLNATGTAPQTGWSTVTVADVDTDFNTYTDPRINNSYATATTTNYGVGSGITGIYYNYCAATVGTYCYAAGAAPAGVDASYDVCPANWRMPTGGANGEYQSLCTTLFGSECTNPTSMTATNANSLQSNLSTPLSGVYNGSQALSRGSVGLFWSSTRSSGYSMYSLNVNSSSVSPQDSNNRGGGFSVRCVAGS